MATPGEAPGAARLAILLSTYNGERFLGGQLASLREQTLRDWRLYWRDDGSQDATPRLMAAFISSLGPERAVVLPSDGRVGASESFLRLLRAARADNNDIVSFCDQDDVWLPQKLALGVAALRARETGTPALYCARQVLVDADLRQVAVSPPMHRVPRFPAALAQNIVTGCTLMLNRAAIELVASSRAPDATLHDWWCYLLVSAAGGALLFDATPVVLYRQHDGNMVGAPSSFWQRGLAALRRGPHSFTTVLRQNVAALAEQPQLIPAAAREQVAAIADALDGGVMRRLSVLRMPGLSRQTWSETMVFRLWFVLA